MEKLIFVYNANSGWHNSVLDSLHKVVSPNTYACSLCDVTYGAFSENEIWKKFRERSTVKMEFLHKDEFVKKYKVPKVNVYDYPVILKSVNGELESFVNANEINDLKKAQDLINVLQAKFLN
ncbi:GTPase [uncultured Maribacter sp.]|uniref:GTPase n=1 Tax=uncultured Maribacter sp. TaxID=431308 RepID=UPI00262481C7|nr:GTPase [uncultured Maribacter sp.]